MTLAVFDRVRKLPVITERLNKSASWSEISFLSSFNTLIGILYGPVALLISSDERISLISSLSIGERKSNLGFRLLGNNGNFYVNIFFSLGLFANSTKVIADNIYIPFRIIYSFILKSK